MEEEVDRSHQPAAPVGGKADQVGRNDEGLVADTEGDRRRLSVKALQCDAVVMPVDGIAHGPGDAGQAEDNEGGEHYEAEVQPSPAQAAISMIRRR